MSGRSVSRLVTSAFFGSILSLCNSSSVTFTSCRVVLSTKSMLRTRVVSLSAVYAAVDQGCPQPLTPRYSPTERRTHVPNPKSVSDDKVYPHKVQPVPPHIFSPAPPRALDPTLKVLPHVQLPKQSDKQLQPNSSTAPLPSPSTDPQSDRQIPPARTGTPDKHTTLQPSVPVTLGFHDTRSH